MTERDLQKAAMRGEPSYVWRAGQERRLAMILRAAGERVRGRILENGCGVGMYVAHLQPLGGQVFGLEYDFARALEARQRGTNLQICPTTYDFESARESHPYSALLTCAAGESLPYPAETFDLILSHEVLEHVRDDAQAVREIVRALRPGGRLALFVPNRGYPFETHGVYWRGKYHFGNIPLVNYLPRRWRDRLAPHVRVYSKSDLEKLFADLPVKVFERTVIFGAYDNVIARFGILGKALRWLLQWLENTPLKALGLSHFWVVEKTCQKSSR